MIEKQRLAEAWNQFSRMVIAKDAGPIQRKEMRMAFYGGATALFTIIMNILEPGAEATDKDLVTMDEIWREMTRYKEEIQL
jgi:hypothetical protein